MYPLMFCFSFFLLSFSLPIYSQVGNFNEALVKNFEDSSYSTHESIYIQTSKDIYETGEDLWFKAYVLNSQTLSPSIFSKTLYLQLVNEKTKKLAWQEKYEINDGFSDGRILLKEYLDEGNYLIEAFTANSFFADSSQFTSVRKIKVVNDISNLRYVRAEFEKPYLTLADSINIKLTPLFRNDTSAIQITINLNQNGQNTNVLRSRMILNEEKKLAFKAESIERGSSLIISTKYKDHTEEMILPVPGRSNPVQFNVFPEGGTLVAGIKSKIAFKAVAINGEPVNVKGLLYKNDSVYLEFSSVHAGMGYFELVPSANAKYYIKLKEPITDSTYVFPEIEQQGMTMRLLSRDRDYLNFQVSRVPYNHSEKVYILSQIRGIIYGLSEVSLLKDLKIKIPLAEMPQGIAEVTLFNEKLNPVAERLVYVNPQRKIKIQTVLSDSIVPTRGKVNLKIIATDENNMPVRANLALSVFDKIYENQTDSTSILTHMYLSSQLKGRIFNPAYYFNEKNTFRESALDLLLLTQGWRKYVWSEANLSITSANNAIVTDGIMGKAFVANSAKAKISNKQVLIMAYSPEKDSVKKVITATSEGRFLVTSNLLSQWKGQYIYLKPLTSSGSTIRLEFINPFDSINSVLNSKDIPFPLTPLPNDMQVSEAKFDRRGLNVIKDVVIKGSGKGVIRGKYLGVLDSLASFSANINTDYVCKYGYLNCPVHLKDPENRKPNEGEIVKILQRFGTREIIYHYRPPKRNYSEEELLKMLKLFRIRSYYQSPIFYQPKYDEVNEFMSLPDYRNTLVWAPSIITDSNGEADFSFFSSDLNTEFEGRIEGIGGEALLGTSSFKFNVRKPTFNP